VKTRDVWLLEQGCGKWIFASSVDAKAFAENNAAVRWTHPRAGQWLGLGPDQSDDDPDPPAATLERVTYHPRDNSMRRADATDKRTARALFGGD
jgi:hypothetical protein